MAVMRLQKFLSAAGVCSRRRGEVHIRDGRVRVNGVVVTTPGTSVDPQSDRVTFDNQEVRPAADLIYIALHKPPGYVTSCHQENEKIVLDLVDLPVRLFPVGRLDKDSTGLLLLTNDGRIHHRLAHPSFDHEKEYEVVTAAYIPDGALERMAQGMAMLGAKTRPAVIKRLGPKKFRITLKEGKNRQIRRMVQKVGHRVLSLKRVRMAHVRLGKLKPGQWRYLNEREVRLLVGGL